MGERVETSMGETRWTVANDWVAVMWYPPVRIQRGKGCHAYPALPRHGGVVGHVIGLVRQDCRYWGPRLGTVFVSGAPIGLLEAPVEMLLVCYNKKNFQTFLFYTNLDLQINFFQSKTDN